MSVIDLVKRYWMWIGAGTVLLIYLARGRGGEAARYPVPPPVGVPDQTQLETAEKELKLRSLQLEQQYAEQSLKRQSVLEELYSTLLATRLQRDILTEQRLIEKTRQVPIRCPSGKTRLSPTGELYCREEQHKGGLPELWRRAQEAFQLYMTYQTGYPGTPPIVPGGY